jgi:hypothetical protein
MAVRAGLSFLTWHNFARAELGDTDGRRSAAVPPYHSVSSSGVWRTTSAFGLDGAGINTQHAQFGAPTSCVGCVLVCVLWRLLHSIIPTCCMHYS